jgi:ADP-heptose:LPS heptosyltransferase
VNICIVSFARLGDTVCKLPALWALRGAYPRANICLVSQSEQAGAFVASDEVLKGTGLVDSFEKLVIRGPRLMRWLNRLALIYRMRRVKWDLGFVLMPNYPPATIEVFRTLKRYLHYFGCVTVSGSSEVAEFRRNAGRLERLPHVSDNMLESLANLGIPIPAPQTGCFFLPPRHEHTAWARSLLERDDLGGAAAYAAVSLGANMPANVWPSERYAEVLRYMWKTYRVAPIFFGPATSKREIESAMGDLTHKIVCAGEPISRVAELMRQCSFYLGNDTGLMHLAVSVGLKCVMVSGARNAPGIWEPYGKGHIVVRSIIDCEGCLLQTCVQRNNQCLMDIPVQDVLEAVEKVYRPLCKN